MSTEPLRSLTVSIYFCYVIAFSIRYIIWFYFHNFIQSRSTVLSYSMNRLFEFKICQSNVLQVPPPKTECDRLHFGKKQSYYVHVKTHLYLTYTQLYFILKPSARRIYETYLNKKKKLRVIHSVWISSESGVSFVIFQEVQFLLNRSGVWGFFRTLGMSFSTPSFANYLLQAHNSCSFSPKLTVSVVMLQERRVYSQLTILNNSLPGRCDTTLLLHDWIFIPE